jgi:hypothetical protein
MTLSFVQGVYALAATGAVVFAYLMGKTVGANEERARIIARKRNTDRTRRAT